MYLLRTLLPGIFVSELQTVVPLRNLILTTIIILWHIPVLQGQQVWPGDINNNGIVNNIDVLYWAVAKDATGDSRADTSTAWAAQDLPAVLWDRNFPDGLNYAYADCDGDGDVDDDDKSVIEKNYGEVHGVLIPDEYATGDPASDPILLLSTEMAAVAPLGTLSSDLSLGTETDTISRFYGIAFTVTYDPAAVGNQGNDFRLEILPDTWMNGMGDEMVIQFFKNDRDNGIAEYAIVRKDHQEVSGFGQIGTFNIVMEDIVLGYSKIDITDIKMVDTVLNDTLVAPSEIEFAIDSTLTATIRTFEQKGFKLYPNPAGGQQITIEMENPKEKIRRVQLFDATGRLLMEQAAEGGEGKQTLPVSQYAHGLYVIKIYSNKRIYVRSFFR